MTLTVNDLYNTLNGLEPVVLYQAETTAWGTVTLSLDPWQHHILVEFGETKRRFMCTQTEMKFAVDLYNKKVGVK